MLDLYYLRTPNGELVSTISRDVRCGLLQTDSLNEDAAHPITEPQLKDLIDGWLVQGGSAEAAPLAPITRQELDAIVGDLLVEIAEWIEAADPEPEAYEDGIERRVAGAELLERLRSGARLVTAA